MLKLDIQNFDIQGERENRIEKYLDQGCNNRVQGIIPREKSRNREKKDHDPLSIHWVSDLSGAESKGRK